MIPEGLLFLSGNERSDFGQRLSRLRWRRRFPGARPFEASPAALAVDVLAGAERWVAVRDESAAPFRDARLASLPGQVRLPAFLGRFGAGEPHTLAELERSDFQPDCQASASAGPQAPVLAFRTEDFAAGPGEPLEAFLRRLASPPTPRAVDPDFAVFAFGDSSERPRPELTRLVPDACCRLLDVGCGAGAASADLLRLRPGLIVEGVERRPRAAAAARGRLSRVYEGEASEVLALLARAGERYDAFLFADVLEHLPDPVEALTLARALASPGATLVVSVPNVGHLSLVRDLARGRFDPLPAGLADAGHLRWFTRRSLAEELDEAGWIVEAEHALAGAAPAGAPEFLAFVSGWPSLDLESLSAYQWIAVARAGWTGRGRES